MSHKDTTQKLRLILPEKQTMKLSFFKKTLKITPSKAKQFLQFPFTVDCNQGHFTDSDDWIKSVNNSTGNEWFVNEGQLRLEFVNASQDGGFLYVPLGYNLGGTVTLTMRVNHPGETDARTGVMFRAKDPDIEQDGYVAYYRFRGIQTDRWEFVHADNGGQALAGFTPATIGTGEDRDPTNDLWLKVEISGQQDVGNGVRVRVKDWEDGESEPSEWRGETFSTNASIPDTGGIGVYQALASADTHIVCMSIITSS